MILLAAAALFAQILTQGQAYTTADPINPERYGLATQDGRYMVELSDTGDCSSITADQNVYLWQMPSPDGFAMYTAIAALTDDGLSTDPCFVIVDKKMDDTPCFQTDGVCDLNGEE
jgi:hypothetical protein